MDESELAAAVPPIVRAVEPGIRAALGTLIRAGRIERIWRMTAHSSSICCRLDILIFGIAASRWRLTYSQTGTKRS